MKGIMVYKTTDQMDKEMPEDGMMMKKKCEMGGKEEYQEEEEDITENKKGDMFKSIVIGLIEKENLDPEALAKWLQNLNMGKR